MDLYFPLWCTMHPFNHTSSKIFHTSLTQSKTHWCRRVRTFSQMSTIRIKSALFLARQSCLKIANNALKLKDTLNVTCNNNVLYCTQFSFEKKTPEISWGDFHLALPLHSDYWKLKKMDCHSWSHYLLLVCSWAKRIFYVISFFCTPFPFIYNDGSSPSTTLHMFDQTIVFVVYAA